MSCLLPHHPEPLSGLSRHICCLQLQLPCPRHTHLSQPLWVRRPPAAKDRSGARQETALQVWLSSFQQSPNSTACLNQGRQEIHTEGHGRRWVAGSLVKGVNLRSQGRPTLRLAHEKACSLSDKQSVGGCQPPGNKLLCLALGAGGSDSESGVKSRVGASETGQGWTPESHQDLVQRLLLSFYTIFTRS